MSRVTVRIWPGPAFQSRRSPTRILLKALIGGAGLLLALAASAHAGIYHAYSCRAPSGESAPADGWSGSQAGEGPYVADTCAQGGALIAALRRPTHIAEASQEIATWALEVPSPERLVRATLWRAGDTAGATGPNGTDGFSFAGAAQTSVFDECAASLGCPGEGNGKQPLADENLLEVSTAHLGSHLYMTAKCEGPFECPAGGPNGRTTDVYLYGADLMLEDPQAPTAGSPSGPLVSDEPIQGKSSVTFSVSDPGSGIFQALVNIDGHVVQEVPLDENSGHCRTVGPAADGLPAFLYLQPCKKSLTADLRVDSTRILNGAHHLIVSVSDAAGNSATVLDRGVIVENELGACNAQCDPHAVLHPADAQRLRRPLTRRYANSAFDLQGHLLDHAGSPMRGATIELRQQASYSGAQSRLVATTTTDALGAFRLRVPKGPSRVLTVGYRSRSENPKFATQVQYRETVAAAVRLSAPRAARPGRRFVFRGHLAGGYVPPEGALVSLEIFYGGAWREIALLRTNRRGSFAYRYTFAAIGPATYRFRAQLPHTSGYPFASAASRSSYIHLTRIL